MPRPCLGRSLDEATAGPPSETCHSCSLLMTMVTWDYEEWARNEGDAFFSPGCVWCDVGSYTWAVRRGHEWVPTGQAWGHRPTLEAARPYVEEFLRVAALERPQATLPTVERAMELWRETFAEALADPADLPPSPRPLMLRSYAERRDTAMWTLRVLNPHLSARDARVYTDRTQRPVRPTACQTPCPVLPSTDSGTRR